MNGVGAADFTTEQNAITTVLAEVASAVVGHFEMETLLNQIVNSTMKILNAEVCSVFLEDKENEPGFIKCVAGSGFASKIVGIAKYRIGEGFTGTVAQVGGKYNSKSREEHENFEVAGRKVWKGKFDTAQWETGASEFRNGIALPLRIKDQILGVIKVENKRVECGDYFADEDVTVFETIANVIALTIENARLHQQIEAQLKTIAAKAAHRMNNQVASYDGLELDLLDEANCAIPSKENIRELAQRLGHTTANLKRMITEFKNYGGPVQLKKTRANMNKLVKSEVVSVRPPEGIKVLLDTDPNLPEFKFDEARFSDSIKELLHNAIRAIQESQRQGVIRISTKLVQGDDTTAISDKAAMLVIEDNGPGFPRDFPVFAPFHSTDPHRTGLGLATVKELAEAHGGKVNATLHKGEGCRFEVVIPIEGRDQ